MIILFTASTVITGCDAAVLPSVPSPQTSQASTVDPADLVKVTATAGMIVPVTPLASETSGNPDAAVISTAQETVSVAETPIPTNEMGEDQTTGEVLLWHAYQADSAEEAVLVDLIDAAQEQFSGLSIQVVQVPFSEIFTTYQLEAISGVGPDLFVAPNDDLGDWARNGLVLPLDDYLQDKLDNVTQVGLDGMTVDGKLYGIPGSVRVVAMYYNASLVSQPPTTTAELLKSVAAGHTLLNVQNAYHLFGWSGAFGGQLLDADGICIADQGGWVDFNQYLVDLKEAGAIFEPYYGRAEDLFRQGEAAYFVNGSWGLADYRQDLGENLGVVPMPSGPGGPATPFNVIDGFYINPNGENIEAAIELALFLTNKESSQAFSDRAGHVPVRSDVVLQDPLLAAFAEAASTGYTVPHEEYFVQYWEHFGVMFDNLLEGAVSPEGGVIQACAAINAENGK